ncbi:peptidoglycan recognition protein 1-like isoform 2-T3 [Discoglossus pictus]
MMKIVVVLLTFCVAANCCPTIISRAQWGSRNVRCHTRMKTPVPYVIIHHTAGASCNSQSTCSAQVRSMQNYHINNQRWCDIGYSFLVGEDGRVYEGRGWTNIGVHAPGFNSKSIGISFIGTFTSRNPSAAAQNAAKSLIRCGVSKGFIRSNYILKGHRDVSSTDCPGNTFYRTVRTWPSYKP